MGAKNTRESTPINASSFPVQFQYPQASPYPYPSAQHHQSFSSPPSYGYGPEIITEAQRRLKRKYSRIADDYKTLDQVTDALATAGLESSNLIVGIDFTKSNEWTGAKSFNRRSLHNISSGQNPYEQAISIIGRTLAAFDDDNLIPCFGFGDASTHDQDVFSFYEDQRPCYGFEEVLTRYREMVPQLQFAGPTSFAPIIEMATSIVEQSGGQYHVLLIISDGQVTRSVDIQTGQLSSQEQRTIDAIVKASKYPLSIILVGVGDGSWDTMRDFKDKIPGRAFDNFQFVDFNETMMRANVNQSRRETEFAFAALMDIPTQYKATIDCGILGGQTGNTPERVPLPPALCETSCLGYSLQPSCSSCFKPYKPYCSGYDTRVNNNTAPCLSTTDDNLVCPICLTDKKDMAFGCGHQTCRECGKDLQQCPICRTPIQTRIRLY